MKAFFEVWSFASLALEMRALESSAAFVKYLYKFPLRPPSSYFTSLFIICYFAWFAEL